MRRQRLAWIACGLFSWLVLYAASTAMADDTAEQAADVSRLVHSALAAAAQGDADTRAELLSQALQAAPDDAAANWHSGRVQVDGRWHGVAEACLRIATDEDAAGYRERLQQTGPLAADQMALAKWCKIKGLPWRQRAHLMLAVQAQPNLPHAVRELGWVRFGNRLITPQQRDQMRQEADAQAKSLKTWQPTVRKLARLARSNYASDRERAAAEIRQIDDPSAIAALEAAFAKSSATAHMAVVDAVSRMSDPRGVDSLVRLAVLSPYPEVAQAAAEALGDHSLYSYMPTLLAALRSPLEIALTFSHESGRVLHTLSVLEEGPLANFSYQSSDGTSLNRSITQNIRTGAVTDRTSLIPDMTLNRDLQQAVLAERANQVRQRMNERITSVVNLAAKQELPAIPNSLWNWWYDYNDYYRPEQRPTYESTTYNVPSPRMNLTYTWMSCFVAGTPVWTARGPQPIEQIQPGELVLAQDPDSGELAFQPVLGTTRRPPCPTLDVQVGDAAVTVSRGHPLWVCGIGWQMAKELRPGQWLHTANGPTLIDAVETAPRAECFNLIVADFHSYFVTDAMLLVHDNELRQPTRAQVPGLLDP